MASTVWGERSVPTASSPEKLASLVNSALDGAEGLLFTATPREELDEIGRFQQLKDQAWAGMVRAIVAAYNRAPQDAREFAPDEVALAIGASVDTAAGVVAQALSAAALPGLVESVAAGILTERHVAAVLRELDAVGALTLEQRQCVVLVMLARYRGQTPGELIKVVRRLILTIDRAAAQARQEQATRARRVAFYADADGQAVLHARGPIEAIAAIKAALEASKAAAGKPSAEDERTANEREFDLFVDLLTGTTETAGWHAHVVMPYSTALGGDVELADIPGFGPILPSTAHDLLNDALDLTGVNVDQDGTVFSVNDPRTPTPAAGSATEAAAGPAADADGEAATAPAAAADPAAAAPSAARLAPADPVLAALRQMALNPAPAGGGSLSGVAGYRVPKRVKRFLEARDRTCVFPGCTRPAAQTDKDHRIPWPAGDTHPDNLQCLCRRHHRAKQAAFTVELTADLDYRWMTRGGWQFLRKRQGY